MRTQGISRLVLLTCLATSFSVPVLGQTLFIHDATVYTMGVPALLPRADILVLDGRVSAVGQDLAAPESGIVIDAAGRTVTPGLFAGITALGLEEISAEISTVDQGLQWDRMRPEFDVTPAYNPNSTAIPVTRIEGYTWALLGARRLGSIIGGTGRAVALDGGYDSFLSNPVLFIGLGSATSALSGQSRAAQFMLLSQALVESQSPMAWSPDALLTTEGRSVVARFRESGTVVFDADRASDILQVVQFAEREHIRAAIGGGAEAWMVADALAEAGVPVLVDPLLNLPGMTIHRIMPVNCARRPGSPWRTACRSKRVWLASPTFRRQFLNWARALAR
jgi:hypothetical protein